MMDRHSGWLPHVVGFIAVFGSACITETIPCSEIPDHRLCAAGDASVDSDLPPLACETDEDCPDLSVCIDEVCAQCRDDASCDGDTPACDVATASCVPCTQDSHCTDASAPFCNVDTFTCVPCLTSDQCTSPTAARCTEAFECAGCQSNDDCQGVPGASICKDQQVCVECTRNRHCPREGGGLFVCDTDQNRCTDLPVGETGGCESCRFNAQCQEDMLCVPMTFGTPEAGIQDVGSFCLPLAVDMGCLHVNPPYRTLLAVEERTFCSVNHVLTTCPAVLQLQGPDVVCAVDEDCGLGGVCYVIGDNGRCSYPCEGTDDCSGMSGQCFGLTPSSPGICI